MVRPSKDGNYLKIGKWPVFISLGWRFVFGRIMRWEGRKHFPSDVITTMGLIKLLLSYF